MMQISELLFELDFQGSPCTKDCSGHTAGYAWAKKPGKKDCNSKNASFNAGCNIAKKQAAPKSSTNNIVPDTVVDQEEN